MGDGEPTDLAGKSWKEISVRWLFGQSVPVILLFAILGVLVFGGKYAIETAIPSHLNAIQDGYERMEKVDSARYEAVREHNAEMLKYVVDHCCGSAAEKSK